MKLSSLEPLLQALTMTVAVAPGFVFETVEPTRKVRKTPTESLITSGVPHVGASAENGPQRATERTRGREEEIG